MALLNIEQMAARIRLEAESCGLMLTSQDGEAIEHIVRDALETWSVTNYDEVFDAINQQVQAYALQPAPMDALLNMMQGNIELARRSTLVGEIDFALMQILKTAALAVAILGTPGQAVPRVMKRRKIN